MQLIPLTKGRYAKVDDEDYPQLSQYAWHIGSTGYAQRSVWLGKNQRPRHINVPMHRQILMVTDSRVLVDHIDGDKLNNQRANLRPSTKSTNGCNRGKTRANTTGFKGVTKHSQCNRYIAQIRVNGKNHYLGMFKDAEEAAAAYDVAAIHHFGEYASTNGVALLQ